MTQFRKRRFAVLRLGAAIPVVAAMMMLCSFTVKTPLPAAGDPDRPTVTVHISSGGKILFNGRPVTVGDLERLIAAERENSPKPTVRRWRWFCGPTKMLLWPIWPT